MDISVLRRQFPVLDIKVNNKPLVYLDNAATVQNPIRVIEKYNSVYKTFNSNIHRGVHYLSNICTTEFEQSRTKISKFINAAYSKEVIFTSGTTASLNMLAFSFGETYIGEGDEIIVSEMEHHSNIVPWQMLCDRKKAVLKVIPFNDNGELDISKFDELLTQKTKLVSVAYISNTLGTINPIADIVEKAHGVGALVAVDAAQAIQHIPVNVQKLDVDFLAFSGHKIYAPTGIGVLYGKAKYLEEMVPWQGGGEMIQKVTFEKTTYNELPFKFEAGTPNYAAAIALGEAIDFVSEIGFENIHNHEQKLFDYAFGELSKVEDIRFFGTANNRTSLISFLIGNIHPFDMGTLLDKMGIAIRTGHHCAEPVMQHFNIPGTMRISFAAYNNFEEIDSFLKAIKKIRVFFE